MKICKNGRRWGLIDTDYNDPEYIEKQRNAKVGSKNPNWKGGIAKKRAQERLNNKSKRKRKPLPLIKCKQCGEMSPNPKPYRKRIFCSSDCRNEYMRINPVGIPFQRGCEVWNAGLTKESDPRVARNAEEISRVRMGKYKGKDNPFYGKHHSGETKKLIGSYHFLNARNVAKGYYGRGFNAELKLEIKIRDAFACQECGVTEQEGTLAIHHIDYDTTNHDPSNLITLCNRCNSRANYKRADWVKHYQSLMKRKQLTLNQKVGDTQ